MPNARVWNKYDNLFPSSYTLWLNYPLACQSYYEVFNKPHVDLIDLNKCPITEVTPKGILTADGVEHELDVIVFATGFDSVTGGITQVSRRINCCCRQETNYAD